MTPDESSITDDVIADAIGNFTRLSERRGAPRLEREAFAGMALMLTLLKRDHTMVIRLDERVKTLEDRNIITWVINHPKVSLPIIALLLIDLVRENLDPILAMLGIK